MSPALVCTVAAIAGAVGIWRITGGNDRDRPDEPDTQTAAQQSGLITTPGEDTP